MTRSTHTQKRPTLKFILQMFILGLILGFSAVSARALPQPVPSAASDIGDEYNVVYKDGVVSTATSRSGTRALVSMLGGQVLNEYDYAFNGFSARLSPTALEALQKNPNIAFIEKIGVFYVDPIVDPKPQANESISNTLTALDFNTKSVQTVTDTHATNLWGLDRIDQNDLPLNSTYGYNNTGSGVNVYVIDTGIRASHVEFGGRAVAWKDEIGDNNFTCEPHGTHVAGTIGGINVGVAKGVNIYAVRVLDCTGYSVGNSVIDGINYVIANHTKPAVINMSLGGGKDLALNTAVKNAVNAGITVVVAAGNEETDACTKSPASEPTAITVGATDYDDWFAYYFSNYGSCVDINAPGYDIYSSISTSNTAYDTYAGTSMATPHVAGVAALYLEKHPTATPAQVTAALVGQAVDTNLLYLPANTVDLLLNTQFDVSPIAIAPSGSGDTDPPEFSWNEFGGSSKYNLVVLKGATEVLNKELTAATYCTDGACAYTPTSALTSGDYTWKIRGYQAATTSYTSFNTATSFTITGGAPSLISPSGLITDTTPTFSWSDTGATQYHLRVQQGGSDVYVETVSSSACTTNCGSTPTTALSLDTDYTWSVDAYDGSTWSGYGTANSVRVVELTPTGPTNVSLNGKPTLTWTEVSGASGYTYQILSGASVVRSGTVGSSACVSGECSVAITSALGSGSFTWHFKATVNSATSDYSDPMDLTVARATLTAPSGTISDKTPTYTFNALTGATDYQLGVMQGSTPILLEEFSASGCSTTCSYTPTTELSNGAHTWFINAKFNSVWSDASDLKSFTVLALTPISPSGTTLDTNPTYTFEEVPGAERYKYEVYQGNTLKFYVKPYPTACVDGICTDNGGSNLTPGDYRWRLTAKVNGVWMIYSDYMDFTVAALTQIAPKGTITDDTPTFSWTTVPGATNYELVVSGLSPVEVPSTDCSTNCTYTFADPFNGGSYTWKVRMYLDGAWTAYTSNQAFSLLKLSTISPSGTTLDSNPPYVFTAVDGATRYLYEVWQGAVKKFAVKPYPTICSGGTCTDTSGSALAAGDYRWRYQAKVGGVWTVFSDFEDFTVAALTPIAPKGTITDDTPTFTWSTVPGATNYELVVSGLSPVEVPSTDCSTNCTYTFADPFNGGSYTWKVRMYLDGAWTAYTSNQAFNLMKLSTISPSGTTLDSNPPYVFTAVAGATRYNYQVYQGATLKFSVKPYPTICSAGTCTDTKGSALAAGDYRWRYQAKVGGVWTVFSDFEDFTVAALTPIAPKGTITDDTPTFSWTTVTGATKYELVVSGLDPVEIPSGDCSTNCAYTFADPFDGGSYTWKVRMYLDGAWTAYTSNQAFSLLKLSTISPSGTTLDTNPPYVFTAVAGATRYKYEVYQGNTLKFYVKPYPTVCSGNTCTDTAGSNLAAGDYRWRYQAKVGGVWTVFSDFEDFTVAALTQIAVNGTVTTDTPTFIWSAVPGATNYELVVSGLDPVEIPATDCAANCEYTFADPLANGSYTWKVRMYLDGVWSDYTGLEAFKVQALTLLTPEGTITTKRPVYSWHSIPGAYKYKYEVYRGNSLVFYKKVVPADFCSGNTCAHDSGVNLANGDHSWRLQVKIDGVWSVFSESKNFTVDALVNSLDTRSWRAYTDILNKKIN